MFTFLHWRRRYVTGPGDDTGRSDGTTPDAGGSDGTTPPSYPTPTSYGSSSCSSAASADGPVQSTIQYKRVLEYLTRYGIR